jgi:hypothetical protein
MSSVRRLGVIFGLLCVLVPASASVATASAHRAAGASPVVCTAFGRTWMNRYNAAGGPIKIVSSCCGHRSVRTHNSACTVMVTGRKGMMGEGMFGCSIATVAANGNILANRALDCAHARGLSSLPA